MRYWAMALTLVFLMMSFAHSQDGKKKDTGKEKEPPANQSMEMIDFLGRGFKEWQKDIKDIDPTKREAGMRNVLQFGADKAYAAVPDIIDELRKHSKKRVDLSVCVTGTMALSTIFKYKKDPDPKDIKAAVAIFRIFLRDDQLLLRIRAVQGLPYLGPTGREAFPELFAMAKEPATWEARKEAIQAFGYLGFKEAGKPDVVVLGEMFKAMSDTSSHVRIAAIRTSASLARNGEGQTKAQVFSKFKSAIENDPDKHVVLAAHMAHMALEGKVTPIHLNPMIKMLKHENTELRLESLQYLGAVGKDAKSAIPALKECTDDPEVTVAVNAIIVMASVDPDNSMSLFARIKDNTKYPDAVRSAAADAMAYRDNMAKEKEKMKTAK